MISISWLAVREAGRKMALFLPFSGIGGILGQIVLLAHNLNLVVVLCYEAIS